MAEHKNKSIVPFIKSQIPKHITDSDSLFPSFLEAYYEWLNKPNNVQSVLYSISNVTDIDKSIDSFTDEFFSEYLNKFPKELLTNKSLTIKHIIDLYKAKGTPAAYKLLFKILYNKSVDLIFPGDYVFKPSDNKWVQDFTFFIEVRSGDVSSIVGEQIAVNSTNGVVYLFIERVKHVSDNFYQVFFDKNYIGTFQFGDTISYNGLLAVISPTTTKISIKQKGRGFKLGDIFYISDGLGSGTSIRVNKVDSNGGILSLLFIEYGVGYKSNFDFNISTAASTVVDTVVPGANTVANDYIQNIIDSGYVAKSNYYNVEYVDPLYIADIQSTFYNETATAIDDNAAILSVEIGTVAKYVGYFDNNHSFASDSIYIQDSEYYQSYSYILNTEMEFNEYKNTIKRLIHPVGFAMFGQREIKNTFNLGASLQNLINAFRLSLNDEATITDALTYSMICNYADSVSATDYALVVLTFYLADDFTVADALDSISITKQFFDTVSVADAIDYINRENPLNDSTSTVDVLNYSIGKDISDTFVANDGINNITTTKPIEDSFGLSDIAEKTITKIFGDSITVTDVLDSIIPVNLLLDATNPVTDLTLVSTSKVLNDEAIITDLLSSNINKVLTDVFGLSDLVAYEITKSFADSVSQTDSINSINTDKVLTETVALGESYSFNLSTSLSDSASPDDTGTVWINPYVLDNTGYFAEDYMDGISVFT